MDTEQENKISEEDKVFAKKVIKRMNQMHRAAGEVAEELGLPAEDKYTVLSTMYKDAAQHVDQSDETDKNRVG